MTDEFHQSVLLDRVAESNEELVAQVVLLVEEVKLLRARLDSVFLSDALAVRVIE